MKVNKRTVLEQELRKVTQVKQPEGKSALEVINFITKKQKVLDKNFYFEDFRKMVVSKNISHDAFIRSIFLLAIPSLALLKQCFEAKDENGEFHRIDDNIVAEMLATKMYTNPITKMALSDQEFNEQVRVYFVLTDKFKSHCVLAGG